MRRALVIDCLAAALLAALVLATVGPAHDKDTFYTKHWASGERNQDYGFANAVPTGNFRDRVQDGAQEWNALAGNMQFHRGGVDVNWSYGDACNAAGNNSIHYGNIDGPPVAGQLNTAAQTRHCYYTDRPSILALFRMRFDEDDPWYRDTGNPPSDRIDLWSLAAHEFGHATGFGQFGAQDHFGASSVYCDPPKQTMCPSTSQGSAGWRSLEDHDRHTFNNQYN